MDNMTGTSRRRASANASSDQGHQSTGWSACWARYVDVDPDSPEVMSPPAISRSGRRGRPARSRSRPAAR
jgi:hypothetical protein